MARRTFASIGLIILILGLGLGKAQVSGDWHKRYGQPEAERYALPNGFVLTVSYSATGRTCGLTVESAQPKSRAIFEGLLNEVVPPDQRGKKLRSIGLSNLVESTRYDRVSVSFYPTRENIEEIRSASVSWHGVRCSGSD